MSLTHLIAFLGTAFVVLVPLCLPLPRRRSFASQAALRHEGPPLALVHHRARSCLSPGP